MRATAVVFHQIILLRHLQLHAIAEQPRVLGVVSHLQLLANNDRAVSLQGISHGEERFYIGHINNGDNGIVVDANAP